MTDTASLSRIDSFPYRHRVHEVMGSPLVTVRPGATLAEAALVMHRRGISSLVVVDEDGHADGIVTERDVLKAVAEHRREAADIPLGSVMSAPVATIRHDAFIYAALGRMDRLHLRHLVAVDETGRAVGVVTARGLLRLRAGSALVIGDEIDHAHTAPEMDAARARLPALARDLLAEGVDGLTIAAVASSVLRDLTARAARLAEDSLIADSWGQPPAPYCVLLLGSGGRHESLFHPDQDNAIVHAGRDQDDSWFAELANRMCALLNQAGIPLCKGGVMAQNPPWRHNLDGWRAHVENWIAHADGEELLNVHIFVDFRPVWGDNALAVALRSHLTDRAAGSAKFLHALAQAASATRAPLGLFGQFALQDGRLEIKKAGLLPLTSTVRVLALKHRIATTGTGERLDQLAQGGHMSEAEAKGFKDSHELMIRVLIRQQVADAESGRPVGNAIDPRLMTAAERRRLKAAFKNINALTWVMREALSTV